MKLLSRGKSKGFPLFMFLMIFSLPVMGQNSEIGIGLGGLSYTGDLHRGYKFLKNRPAATIFYRHTFSNAVSIRGGFTGGQLVGSDDKPMDEFAAARNREFDLLMLEGAVTIEYNFLDFLHSKSFTNYSPYLFLGIGAFTMFGEESRGNKYKKIQPSIPLGVGMKFLLDPRWQLGVEFGARKTFFDYLDNVSGFDETASKKGQNYQYGNQFDQDWYYFVGVTLSYTFYSIPCPYAP